MKNMFGSFLQVSEKRMLSSLPGNPPKTCKMGAPRVPLFESTGFHGGRSSEADFGGKGSIRDKVSRRFCQYIWMFPKIGVGPPNGW